MVLTIFGQREKKEIELNISCIGVGYLKVAQDKAFFTVYLTKEQKEAIQGENMRLEVYGVCEKQNVYVGHLFVFLSDIFYEMYDNTFSGKVNDLMEWSGL